MTIWCRGYYVHGVVGIDLEEFKTYIEEFKTIYNDSIGFWWWLRYEKDLDVEGFSALWNDNETYKMLMELVNF